MKRVLILFVILLASCSGVEHVARIDKVDDFKSSYVESRGFEVWLPSQYSEFPGQRFRVLYMHDGQNVFNRVIFNGGIGWLADSTANELINSGQIDPIIIVAVNNTSKRFNEYCPQKPIENASQSVRDYLFGYRNLNLDTVLLADAYLKFLVEEVKPYIDANYRTLKAPEYTAICGSSMGGLISMYAMSEYPNVFGQAACLSTHWPLVFDNNNIELSQTVRDYMVENFPKAGKHKIYFDYGTTTLDELYEVHQLKVDTIVMNKGYSKGKDWETLKFEGEPHNEVAWAARFDTVLKFLYKK